ncbi:homeobox protein goosecoid-2-like isoform X2 [Oryzias latipes]|uniref:homeobox protein goosecoid-2-like isoform X2 n=1 Tax=Oryzias latipes TaxID=8090 RepID=UPI0009DA06E1|nr:homeobox protein goosecoid-2-like isoform X2 [Oryzias latipes]
MDARALSDFSIEHLLSPEVGSRPQVEDTCLEGPLRPTPGGPCPWAPAPVPMLVPVPVCLQYRGFTMDRFCPCRAGLHHPNFPGFIPSCALFQHFVQNRAEAPHHSQEPQQPRQKARMRTVFTEAQSRQLEALFQVTDYPTAEARAELSARTGLTEETIRVWFKNRRARRKRQRSASKVRSQRPSSISSIR